MNSDNDDEDGGKRVHIGVVSSPPPRAKIPPAVAMSKTAIKPAAPSAGSVSVSMVNPKQQPPVSDKKNKAADKTPAPDDGFDEEQYRKLKQLKRQRQQTQAQHPDGTRYHKVREDSSARASDNADDDEDGDTHSLEKDNIWFSAFCCCCFACCFGNRKCDGRLPPKHSSWCADNLCCLNDRQECGLCAFCRCSFRESGRCMCLTQVAFCWLFVIVAIIIVVALFETYARVQGDSFVRLSVCASNSPNTTFVDLDGTRSYVPATELTITGLSPSKTLLASWLFPDATQASFTISLPALNHTCPTPLHRAQMVSSSQVLWSLDTTNGAGTCDPTARRVVVISPQLNNTDESGRLDVNIDRTSSPGDPPLVLDIR